MSRFPWREDYAVGDPLIDAQHQRLVALADLLVTALDEGRPDDVVDEALAALVVYTSRHFADEEAYWGRIGSPLLEEHKAQHNALAHEVTGMEKARERGDRAIAERLVRWVTGRLIPHMTDADRAALEAAPAAGESRKDPS